LLTPSNLEAEVHFDETKTLGLAIFLTAKPLGGRQWHGHFSSTLGRISPERSKIAFPVN